jgi:CheY-like chemotaxis protein/two-component sensor histidine kinase
VDLVLLSAEKGAALAHQLLLFGRGQASAGARTEVVEQTRSLVQILTRIIGKQVTLELHTGEDPIFVGLDPGQYEQVLMNLVINARDAMPDGGSVRITITPLPDTEGALLEVADSGTGMTEEVAQRIFEPFFTTKDSGEGTGLGLSVVYGIVTAIQGEVHVDSAPGKGTTFTMRLPGAAPALSGQPKRAAPSSGLEVIPGRPQAVLLEDHADLRRLTTRGLEQMGFEVYPCSSIAQARAEFEMLSGAPDLLVTDVRLDDGNGLDLAEELAARGQVDKVVITTGHANLGRVDALILQHGWRLLMKPFSPRQLGLIVSQVMSEA